MKRILFLLLITLNAGFSFAQDKITKSNGDVIKCKVVSIDSLKLTFEMKSSSKVISSYAYFKNIVSFTYQGQTYLVNENSGIYTPKTLAENESDPYKINGRDNIGIRFGMLIGLNSSFSHKIDDERKPTDPVLGVNAGLSLCVTPKSDFDYVLSVFFTQRGYKINHSQVNINYIDVESSFNMGGSGSKLFVPLGFYFGYGINGKDKYQVWGGDIVTDKIKFKDDDFNRIDGGLIVGIGVNVDKVKLSVNYKHGLLDFEESDNYTSIRHGLVNFSVLAFF